MFGGTHGNSTWGSRRRILRVVLCERLILIIFPNLSADAGHRDSGGGYWRGRQCLHLPIFRIAPPSRGPRSRPRYPYPRLSHRSGAARQKTIRGGHILGWMEAGTRLGTIRIGRGLRSMPAKGPEALETPLGFVPSLLWHFLWPSLNLVHQLLLQRADLGRLGASNRHDDCATWVYNQESKYRGGIGDCHCASIHLAPYAPAYVEGRRECDCKRM